MSEPEKTEDEATRPVSAPAQDDTETPKDPPPERDAAPIANEDTLGPAWLPLALAIAAPILFFFVLPPLTKSGLWDPYELNVADLARRVALNLHGASSLALEATDNSLPHLNNLGRPQLPFTSIALGFKYFGLHEWAGRAPLAAWGVLGVVITYGFVARLVDRRAGLFAAVALTSMPLFFVHARTMLGDIVQMTAFAGDLRRLRGRRLRPPRGRGGHARRLDRPRAARVPRRLLHARRVHRRRRAGDRHRGRVP